MRKMGEGHAAVRVGWRLEGRLLGRTILHLDLDAFFASVEQLDDPSLRGRPVIVGGPSRRGVVSAASYEARRFGVRSAMPTAQAQKLCPQGVFLPPRFERYRALSEQVFANYRRYTPLVEPLSLDEAFLDVSESRALFGGGRDIALAIKRSVRQETGLTVSAGIADCKMAAKIASDLGKPDGLVEVAEGAAAGFLAPLPVGRLWGVGQVTEAALRRLGIQTIGELARFPEGVLAERFGVHGKEIRTLAQGDDPRPVVPDEEAKSIGAEDTFEEDLTGEEPLLPHLLDQSQRVARRLRAAGKKARTVTLKLKYADFTQVTRRCTLRVATDDGSAIYAAVKADLKRADLSLRVRLTGVSASGFEEEEPQLGLFERSSRCSDSRREALNAAIDRLTVRFGDGAVRPATLIGDTPPNPGSVKRQRKPRR